MDAIFGQLDAVTAGEEADDKDVQKLECQAAAGGDSEKHGYSAHIEVVT
jgi:hypothetical protein